MMMSKKINKKIRRRGVNKTMKEIEFVMMLLRVI